MKHYRGGCLHCPQTEDILDMDEPLYYAFGGYHVEKDGELFYRAKGDENWESFKILRDIENEAVKKPDAKWRVILNNPLRGATWERNKDGKWILIETNQGFA